MNRKAGAETSKVASGVETGPAANDGVHSRPLVPRALGLPHTVVEAWTHTPEQDALALVLPDGCRDLIVRISADGCPHWLVSELADTAQRVGCQAGETFIGYRFHPAAAIADFALLNAIRGRDDLDLADVEAMIDDHVQIDFRLAEALQQLAATGGVAAAGRQLGVSERSLERLVRTRTGRPPGFWKNLARVRRAAGALATPAELVEIAAEQGYADQAHMSREFMKWFGTPPGRFRKCSESLALAAASGYR